MTPQAAHIAIILPAYNEEITIAATIEDFHAAIPWAAIYVINNNSNDATREKAVATLSRLGASGAVIDEPKQGKGNALRRAFLEVEADIFVVADADSTYPASQVHELIQPILAGWADMVVGDRISQGDYHKENKRQFHSFGNTLVQRLVNLVSGSNMTDIMSGYRAMSSVFVKTYPCVVEGFQVETDSALFAAQNRFRVLDVPVKYVDRPVGSVSKLCTYRDGLRVLLTIFKIFRCAKPLAFFSSLAAVFCFIGTIIGIPVIVEFLETSYITHVPLAILASSVELIAIMALGMGLMLDSVVYHEAINTERFIRETTKARFRPEHAVTK